MSYMQRVWFRTIVHIVLGVFYLQTLNPALLGYAPLYGAPPTRMETTGPSAWQRLLDFMLPTAQAAEPAKTTTRSSAAFRYREYVPAYAQPQATNDPLLMSTPEFDLADPYLVEKADELGNDPQRIFAFVRDEIGFESYTGSLRGARGALWSKAGNALDKASLMIALLRISGVPARYVQGTLSDDRAKELILSMFPNPCKVVGVVPADAKRSDPANDPVLLAEARKHYWVEFGNGGFTAADPSFKAELGQVTASPQGTFAEVPDSLRHKVTIRLKAEFTGGFTGLAGVAPDIKIPLNRTFSTAELVGKPLSVGHFVDSFTPPALLFGYTTHTYSPYILVGQSNLNVDDYAIIRGQDYQEFLTNFPLASQFLTGLFFEVDVINSEGKVDTFERALVDRIGFSIRQNGGNLNLGLDASGSVAISELEIISVVISSGLELLDSNQSRLSKLGPILEKLESLNPQRDLDLSRPEDVNLANQLNEYFRYGYALRTSALAVQFTAESDAWLGYLKDQYFVSAYYKSPRIIIAGNRVAQDENNNLTFNSFIDIRKSDINAISIPGQKIDSQKVFNYTKGLFDNVIETIILQKTSSPDKTIISTGIILQHAADQDIKLSFIDNPDSIDSLQISDEAKARITQSLRLDKYVIIPSKAVNIKEKSYIAWYEIGSDGYLIGVTEDGGHQALIDYGLLLRIGAVAGILIFAGVKAYNDAMNDLHSYQIYSGPLSFLGSGRQSAKTQVQTNLATNVAICFGGGPLALKISAPLALLVCGWGLASAIGISLALATDPPLPDFLIGSSKCEQSTNNVDSGVNTTIVPDNLISVSSSNLALPSAFKLMVHNTGPSQDTFTISLSSVPTGFEILSSLSTITISSGEMAEVGIYLKPTILGASPGTPIPFSINVASTTNPAVSAVASQTFTMPAIPAVTVTSDPVILSSTPGTPVSSTLTITSVGNAPVSNATLAVDATPSLTVGGLTSLISLGVGQSITQTLTLTPAANVPLNSTLTATITATYGTNATGEPLTSSTQIAVQVVAASAQSAINASIAAANIGRPGLGSTLNNLGTALTTLSQDPASETARSRAIGLLNSLIEQLNVPALTPFIADLARLRDAIAVGADIQTALNDLSIVLGNLGGILQTSPDALPFELALQPNNATALPNTPTRFDVALHNTGTTIATYNLSLSALPGGITGGLNQTSVTLAPGQSIPASGGPNVFVTLTPSAQQLAPASFSVTATLNGNSNAARTAEGAFTVRDELVEVVSVAATPGFTNPGGSVAVSARLLNAVNQSRQVQVSYTVKNAQGATVFTASPHPAQLTVLTSLFAVDLGNLDTTGFALGTYTLNVAVADANGTPIPGATGQGSLLVGSPLSATQALTPDILPPGDGLVTASLNLNSLITLPGPTISLLSLTDTDAIASSLAIRDNLAYVCGTENVTIFDITNPSQPQILATFADDLINGSAVTKCRIVDNHLVVFWQLGNNTDALPILVFDLADPLAPSLVSDTNQNRHFISTLFFRDQTAYMALIGIHYIGCLLLDQFGDFATFDFGDFANPQFLDALLNPTNPPDGGTTPVWQGIPVNDQVALVASTTSTLPNVGRVLAVDVSDPANLSTITELQVPGTVHITGVEIQSGLALAVGNTGNFTTFDSTCSANFPLTGNVTLTTLDITDPRNPTLVHTLTTTATAGGRTTVNALGNGFFAVSGTKFNGNPVLMVVDTNDPQNPTFTTISVPTAINESQVVGNILFAPSSSGLGIYDIGNVVGIRYKAQIKVPKNTGVSVVTGSFNLEPTEIVPGTDFDTLVWERALTNSHATQTFIWQAQVVDLQPGEARDVTLATTVDFTAPNGDTGQIELPSLIVISEQILALTPASQPAQLGSPATYTLTVKNPTAAPVTYNLAVLGVPSGWASLAPTLTVPANGSVDQVLTLQADTQATPGDNGFVVTAEAATGVRGSVTGLLTLQGTPGGGGGGTDFGEDVASDAHGIVVTVTPEQPVAGQGTPATFRVRLINTGNVTESFNLAASLPAGISGSFDQTTVEVPPGLDNYREVLLTVTPARGTPPGTQTVTVTATATTQASVQDEASTTLTVASQGVDVAVSPTSGSPSGTFQLIVTNTGQAQDTFDLALGGPLGPAATLGAQTVTLAPGASQTVSITLGAIDFALPGALSFIAVATSRANPAVRDTAMVQVTIPTIQGLAVAFDPKSQTLPNPGLATFLLLVHNTGNTEGAYRAVITGTNGPVTASMDGLDGQPTQSIATFRLPGLSTGAITVDTDLKSAGTGKVTVEVAALDAALTGTDTATVRAQDQPLPRPGGPAAIPTLDEWMQALLALLMLLALAWAWRRRYGR